ncbi:MAG: acetate/propionate family kinase [Pseudomonadota bacterium]
MLILIANLGSTSFKYKLFDMPSETVLAVGAADRIGRGDSAWSISAGDQAKQGEADLPDHAAAVEMHLRELSAMGVAKPEQIEAIGFKAVHGGPISGAVQVTDDVLATMRRFVPLAPAHNPPYIAAMESFRQKLPNVRQVAAFETAFHQTIPPHRQLYGVPYEWATEHGIRRYGFHGASHRYIAETMTRRGKHRVISLHLGGSASVCAIDGGDSVAHSMGTTPQTGLPHANRVGEFDPFAILALREAGLNEEDIWAGLGQRGGLLGISGHSGEMRDIEQAMRGGDERAKLAFDAFVESCRHYLGAYLAVLGGANAIVFTGGIGQHSAAVREAVCENMKFAGIVLDPYINREVDGRSDRRIDHEDSRVQIWVIPTNEELVVARQTYETLNV